VSRPCFLVIDREFPGSISTRKLVLETAKFNVITAYSGREGLETMRRFPGIDGVVMDGDVEDIPSDELMQSFKSLAPETPVIVICPPSGFYPNADLRVDSFQPGLLLEALRGLRSKEAKEIINHEEKINREEHG